MYNLKLTNTETGNTCHQNFSDIFEAVTEFMKMHKTLCFPLNLENPTDCLMASTSGKFKLSIESAQTIKNK